VDEFISFVTTDERCRNQTNDSAPLASEGVFTLFLEPENPHGDGRDRYFCERTVYSMVHADEKKYLQIYYWRVFLACNLPAQFCGIGAQVCSYCIIRKFSSRQSNDFGVQITTWILCLSFVIL